jgi:hypothetical protein
MMTLALANLPRRCKNRGLLFHEAMAAFAVMVPRPEVHPPVPLKMETAD